MNQPSIKDVLSWDQFFLEANKRKFYPPKEIELFNRLICHTENFFIIAAIGAFTPGYLMLITKKLLPSFSMIDDENLDELKWLVNNISDVIKKTYKREIIKFEHGMCACVGGLDRAHLHIMTINKQVDDNLIKESINKVLTKRKAGIDSVEINNHKLENIHDILEIMNSSDSNSYKVNGKQLFYNDIKDDMDIDKWPFSTRPHVNKGGHYVYFKTNSASSSFLTNKNFQTQLGRQIIFEAELKSNVELNNMSQKILKKNNYANIWKWQEFAFKENMLKTMNDLLPALNELSSKKDKNNFNFKAF